MLEIFGGPDRDRTDDLFHAMEARSLRMGVWSEVARKSTASEFRSLVSKIKRPVHWRESQQSVAGLPAMGDTVGLSSSRPPRNRANSNRLSVL